MEKKSGNLKKGMGDPNFIQKKVPTAAKYGNV
jgi:hypothetical protein